jgi:hypothetical protein
LPKLLVTLSALILYLLHQDFWFERQVRPLAFGFLPVGLAYHAAYTLAAAVLMLAAVKLTWPGGDDGE